MTGIMALGKWSLSEQIFIANSETQANGKLQANHQAIPPLKRIKLSEASCMVLLVAIQTYTDTLAYVLSYIHYRHGNYNLKHNAVIS